jgi:catechol 2,3-dioxygenase-like lactoylglutathione lyase family enzyme
MLDTAKSVDAITLFVEDLAAAKDFYRTAFELPVHFEDSNSAVFRLANTLINLLKVEAAHDLIAPAPVGGPGAGGRCQFTIQVDDVDATSRRLQDRGVKLLNGPVDRPWSVRTASFQDPAGHIWEIGQAIPQAPQTGS